LSSLKDVVVDSASVFTRERLGVATRTEFVSLVAWQWNTGAGYGARPLRAMQLARFDGTGAAEHGDEAERIRPPLRVHNGATTVFEDAFS